MSEAEIIAVLRAALDDVRKEALKQKPDPDKIYQIANKTLYELDGY